MPSWKGIVGTSFTPLDENVLRAACAGDGNAVARYADSGGDLNAVDRFGMTLAMHVAARGQLQVLQQLNALDADLGARNPTTGANVLHFAAQSLPGGRAIFEWLAKTLPETFTRLVNQSIGPNNHTVAMEAVFNTNAETARFLLDASKRFEIDFATPAVTGWSPATIAYRDNMTFADQLPDPLVPAKSDLEAFKVDKSKTAWRFQFLADRDQKWLEGFARGTPKHARAARGLAVLRAVQARDQAALDQALIGLDPDGARAVLNDSFGGLATTPLNHLARTPGDPQATADMRRALLTRGADPRTREQGVMMVSAGFGEAVFGDDAGLKDLLETLPDDTARLAFVNQQGIINGYSMLIDAALRGRADVLRLLQRVDADRRLVGHGGMTACAAAKQYIRVTTGTPIPDDLVQWLCAGVNGDGDGDEIQPHGG